MELQEGILIDASKELIWNLITDIENSTEMISGIEEIEILEKPKDGLIGLKWEETRIMFGKSATEIMWITEAELNHYYQTRAESHGSVYISRLSLERAGENTKLTMSFTGEAQTFFVEIMSVCMGFMIKGSMKKALLKDLNDIKNHLESK